MYSNYFSLLGEQKATPAVKERKSVEDLQLSCNTVTDSDLSEFVTVVRRRRSKKKDADKTIVIETNFPLYFGPKVSRVPKVIDLLRRL